MASPTYNQSISAPSKVKLYWNRELGAAGTPAALTAATWVYEGFVGFTPSPQRAYYEGPEYKGLPTTKFSKDLQHQHYTFTLQVPLRIDGGLGAACLASIVGDHDNTGTTEVVTAALPWQTHAITPGIKGPREITYSFILDTGTSSGNDGLLYTYATLSSWKLTLNPGSVAMCELAFTSTFETKTAVPSAAVKPTNTTRTRSTDFTVTVIGSAGTAYTAKPLSGDVTIMRATPEVLFGLTGSLNPLEIAPGALTVTATFDFIYDSLQTGTAMADFLADATTGTATAQHTWSGTDRNGANLSFSSWPAKWAPLAPVMGGQQATHMQGTLDSYQDDNTDTALTFLTNISIKNTTATGLVY